ncbi:MAG TPA: methyltransferase [Vicinamibacterales bacterium]|nr:methyltransferase [Vicinamibacterales bacterium]
MFSHSSRGRLTLYDVGRFTSQSLFDRIARTVCEAGCLPRKELYEAWEVARRVRRLFRGGRVVDLACGHGLLAHIMLLLDDSSPSAVAIDQALPPSSVALRERLIGAWPRLNGRVELIEGALDAVPLLSTDIVVSSHACGALTDVVLERAIAAHARVAVLPCCHDLNTCNVGPLAGWLDGPLAIDAMRAVRLERAGYHVWTQTIDVKITPKNRLLVASHAP